MRAMRLCALLVAALLPPAAARAAELRTVSMPEPPPGGGRVSSVYSGQGLVVRLLRWDGRAPAPAVKAPRDALTFPLRRKTFVFEGRRVTLGRGDFIALPAGTRRPALALPDGAPLEALLVAARAGLRPSGARREAPPREPAREAVRLFSVLRAEVDVLAGPWRSTSAHARGELRVGLLRLDAAILVENPSASSEALLLPVEGAAEVGPAGGAARLQGDDVLVLGPGEKARVEPAPGGPFYAYLITRAAKAGGVP